MDTVSPQRRSEIMARVRSKHTAPEIAVRRLVHGMGYRYRLHRRDLPGSPDLVFVGMRKVMFVHGCFWHRHSGCAAARVPKTRHDFWLVKLQSNSERDSRNVCMLSEQGWDVMIVWECELKDMARLRAKIGRFFDA
jgi:DNA mismatch endonuclease (patch repair protein)